MKVYAWDEFHSEVQVLRRLNDAVFAICTREAGNVVPDHQHEGMSFNVLLGGKHQWLDQEGKIRWSVPGAWYAHAGSHVETHQACSTDVEALCIRFLPERFGVPVGEVAPGMVHSQAGLRIAHRIQQELLRPTPGGDYVLLSCLADLIARFLNSGQKLDASPSHAIVRQALEMLDKRFAANLSLDDVARAVGTNRSTLGRLFRHHLGVSVGEYIRDRRLEWGHRQLTDTNAKISTIAAAAGFADQAHFCRCFKTRYWVKPSSLRNSQTLLAPGA